MDFSSDKQHYLILQCHEEIDGKDQNLQFAKAMSFLSTSPSIFSGLSWANRREDPPFNRKALSLMRGRGGGRQSLREGLAACRSFSKSISRRPTRHPPYFADGLSHSLSSGSARQPLSSEVCRHRKQVVYFLCLSADLGARPNERLCASWP